MNMFRHLNTKLSFPTTTGNGLGETQPTRPNVFRRLNTKSTFAAFEFSVQAPTLPAEAGLFRRLNNPDPGRPKVPSPFQKQRAPHSGVLCIWDKESGEHA